MSDAIGGEAGGEVILGGGRQERRALLVVGVIVVVFGVYMAVSQPGGSLTQIVWAVVAAVFANWTVRSLIEFFRPTPGLRINSAGFDSGDGLVRWEDVDTMRICEFDRFRWVVPRFHYIGVEAKDIDAWRRSKNWLDRLEARLTRRLLGVDVAIMGIGLGLSLREALDVMQAHRSTPGSG